MRGQLKNSGFCSGLTLAKQPEMLVDLCQFFRRTSGSGLYSDFLDSNFAIQVNLSLTKRVLFSESFEEI
jgi:hypothetical protein